MRAPPCLSASCVGTATAIAALHWQMPAQHPLPCQLLGTVSLELGPPLLEGNLHQGIVLYLDSVTQIHSSKRYVLCCWCLGQLMSIWLPGMQLLHWPSKMMQPPVWGLQFTCCSPAAY